MSAKETKKKMYKELYYLVSGTTGTRIPAFS